MGLSNLFKLAKLTVTAYEDSTRSKPVGLKNSLEVQFNPETLSMKHESVFQGRQGIATSSAQARFAHSRSELLNVDLIFDGTNVDYFGYQLLRPVPTVADRVKQFLQLCYQVNSASHEPSYLKLSWDKGVLGPSFDCRLQSVDIKYTSFNRDGSPLHAELSAVFVEDLDPKKKDFQGSPLFARFEPHPDGACGGCTAAALQRNLRFARALYEGGGGERLG